LTEEDFKALQEALHAIFSSTREGLKALIFAVVHGCAAGAFREAFYEVLVLRIERGGRNFASIELSAKSEYLSALSNFFEVPFSVPAKQFEQTEKLQLLTSAGLTLSELGRLDQAIGPMHQAYQSLLQNESWENAGIVARNLSGSLLSLENIEAAVKYGRAAIAHADRCTHQWWPAAFRAGLAHALHQQGRFADAKALYEEAEAIHQRIQQQKVHVLAAEHEAVRDTVKSLDPEIAKELLARLDQQEEQGVAQCYLLHSLSGFNYSEFLLACGQYHDVLCRTGLLLSAAEEGLGPLGIALNHLFLALADVVAFNMDGVNAIGSGPANVDGIRTRLNSAVDHLHEAADEQHLARGLLARAGFLRTQSDANAAERDLGEAESISMRSGMRLLSADSMLERAKLSLDTAATQENPDQFQSRQVARQWRERASALVRQTGYNRRLPDLALVSARLELSNGNVEEAREHLSNAKAIIDEYQLESLRPGLNMLSKLV